MIISRGLAHDAVEKAVDSKTIIRISGDGQIAQFLVMMSKIANRSTMISIVERVLTNEQCLARAGKIGASKETLSSFGERLPRIKRVMEVKLAVAKNSSDSKSSMSSMNSSISRGKLQNRGLQEMIPEELTIKQTLK